MLRLKLGIAAPPATATPTPKPISASWRRKDGVNLKVMTKLSPGITRLRNMATTEAMENIGYNFQNGVGVRGRLCQGLVLAL